LKNWFEIVYVVFRKTAYTVEKQRSVLRGWKHPLTMWNLIGGAQQNDDSNMNQQNDNMDGPSLNELAANNQQANNGDSSSNAEMGNGLNATGLPVDPQLGGGGGGAAVGGGNAASSGVGGQDAPIMQNTVRHNGAPLPPNLAASTDTAAFNGSSGLQNLAQAVFNLASGNASSSAVPGSQQIPVGGGSIFAGSQNVASASQLPAGAPPQNAAPLGGDPGTGAGPATGDIGAVHMSGSGAVQSYGMAAPSGSATATTGVVAPTVTLRAATWARESHGLYDYEARHPIVKNFELQYPTTVQRKGTDVSAISSQAQPHSNDAEPLARLVIRNGKFCVDAARTSEGRMKGGKLWRVVKDLQSGYVLQEGDSIKLGRFKLRVRQVVAGDANNPDTQPQVAAVNPHALPAQSCNTSPDAIKELENTPCRICLLEGSSKEDPLIKPCECKGTIEYVHLACLRHWIPDDWTLRSPRTEPTSTSR
jgi:hypothetical protein